MSQDAASASSQQPNLVDEGLRGVQQQTSWRHGALRQACIGAPRDVPLRGASLKVFELALNSGSQQLAHAALAGIRRMFVQVPETIAIHEDVDRDVVSLDRVVQTVHAAIVKSNQGAVRLEGVNAMLTIVMNDSVRLNPQSLTLVLRACFDVYSQTASTECKTTSQAALIQILAFTWKRLETSTAVLRMTEEAYFEDEWSKRLSDTKDPGSSDDCQVLCLLDTMLMHAENVPARLDDAIEFVLHSRRSTLTTLLSLQSLSMIKVSPHIDTPELRSQLLARDLLARVLEQSGPAFRSVPLFLEHLRLYLEQTFLNDELLLEQVQPIAFKHAMQLFEVLALDFADVLYMPLCKVINRVCAAKFVNNISVLWLETLLVIASSPTAVSSLFVPSSRDVGEPSLDAVIKIVTMIQSVLSRDQRVEACRLLSAIPNALLEILQLNKSVNSLLIEDDCQISLHRPASLTSSLSDSSELERSINLSRPIDGFNLYSRHKSIIALENGIQILVQEVALYALAALSMVSSASSTLALSLQASLDAYRSFIRLSCFLQLHTIAEAFISALISCARLGGFERTHQPIGLAAVATLLKLANEDGVILEASWLPILHGLSQLEHVKFHAVDNETRVQLDQVFTMSTSLPGPALIHLISALCQESQYELFSRRPPWMYFLPRLTHVIRLNLHRETKVLSTAWQIASRHYVSAARHPDKTVVEAFVLKHALYDVLGMVLSAQAPSTLILLQHEFLDTLLSIMGAVHAPDVWNSIVVELAQLVQREMGVLNNGWPTVCAIFTLAAREHDPETVAAIAQTLQLAVEHHVHSSLMPYTPDLLALVDVLTHSEYDRYGRVALRCFARIAQYILNEYGNEEGFIAEAKRKQSLPQPTDVLQMSSDSSRPETIRMSSERAYTVYIWIVRGVLRSTACKLSIRVDVLEELLNLFHAHAVLDVSVWQFIVFERILKPFIVVEQVPSPSPNSKRSSMISSCFGSVFELTLLACVDVFSAYFPRNIDILPQLLRLLERCTSQTHSMFMLEKGVDAWAKLASALQRDSEYGKAARRLISQSWATMLGNHQTPSLPVIIQHDTARLSNSELDAIALRMYAQRILVEHAMLIPMDFEEAVHPLKVCITMVHRFNAHAVDGRELERNALQLALRCARDNHNDSSLLIELFELYSTAYSHNVQGLKEHHARLLARILEELALLPASRMRNQFGSNRLDKMVHLLESNDRVIFKSIQTVLRSNIHDILMDGEGSTVLLTGGVCELNKMRMGSVKDTASK